MLAVVRRRHRGSVLVTTEVAKQDLRKLPKTMALHESTKENVRKHLENVSLRVSRLFPRLARFLSFLLEHFCVQAMFTVALRCRFSLFFILNFLS